MLNSSALYIHIPWCIRKCPYCDFNSHKAPSTLNEEEYIRALVSDFKQDIKIYPIEAITSIFIGGGTPSLIAPKSYEFLLEQLNKYVSFSDNMEITLEANPGTIEQNWFKSYRQIGINRLSLGIQSFNDNALRALGRIHNGSQALNAIDTAKKAGFDNINIDLMYGLPEQTLKQGLEDLQCALASAPNHLSWYQLTLEPNTLFYKRPPAVPCENIVSTLEEAALELLATRQYHRYEISAFSKIGKQCVHNLNYWLFGDYLGIGAGAHGKISDPVKKNIYRTRKYKQPNHYLDKTKNFLAAQEDLTKNALIFEFMLNTSRLEQPIPYCLFEQKTHLPLSCLSPLLLKAAKKGLLHLNEYHWQITKLGRQFTNDLQALFLLE